MLIKSKDERLWHTLGAHAMTGHQNSYGSLCGKRYEGRVDMSDRHKANQCPRCRSLAAKLEATP